MMPTSCPYLAASTALIRSLPPHMQQSWNLLGLDTRRYDPIVEAPEE
jgi:hypothetical protein